MLRLLILLIALGAGGGAAWIAAQMATSEPVVAAPATTAPEMTAVLVAARDVARGGEVTADALLWQTWPSDALSVNFIVRSTRPGAATELAGRFATRPIFTGEPIADAALATAQSGFLAAMLTPGKRALAIQTSPQSTAGGFILPNDRVDVLHTSGVSRGDGTVSSRTILKGVRVLAIDQTSTDTDSETVLGKTATLELTELQVEAVTAAEATGTLSLSLRPFDETPGDASMETAKPARTIRINRGTISEDVPIN